MVDPYVHPGTDTLKNVLEVQDKDLLDDAEADYVSLRLRELVEHPLRGDYGVSHFAKMHKYIFQDIYRWAGKFRTINIEKEEPALGGLSIEYSDKTEIGASLEDKGLLLIERFLKSTAHTSELHSLHIVQFFIIWEICPRKSIWKK